MKEKPWMAHVRLCSIAALSLLFAVRQRDPDDLDAESVSMEEVLLGNREIHNRMGRRFPGRRWSLGEALRPSTLRRPRRPRPSVFVVPVTEMMFTSC